MVSKNSAIETRSKWHRANQNRSQWHHRENPLNHSFLRELKDDFVKYLVIFLLMSFSIAEVSGFLVADESMIKAYNDSFEKYNVEDGHFEVQDELSSRQEERIEENGIKLYPIFYIEPELDNDSQMRIFAIRKDVDLVDLMDGSLPEKTGEIAIDRMYAHNHKINIGDTIQREGSKKSWTVTGLVALSDYSALFQDNNDSMFDAVGFGVGIVSDEEFSTFSKDSLHPCYAWMYDDAPSDEAQEKEVSDDLMKKINAIVPLEKFIPRYANQAIKFTGNDMGSDRAMMTVLLYMIIAILGFVFAVTISNTIAKQSNVIGTLRASGYTRGEIIRHYMVLPLVVTLVSALVGNILGYTVMKDYNASLYYGSYSLPTYRTIWSLQAFVETTLVPIILMVVITFLILHHRMKLTPLQFLRRETGRRHQARAVRLSHALPIFSRYRIRVLFQNIPNYLVLFIGILFADVLLMFGLALPLVLSHYQSTLSDNLLCNYQYILTAPASMEQDDDSNTKVLSSLFDTVLFYSNVTTQNRDAEKFSVNTLRTTGEHGRLVEDVTLYGIENHSRYVKLSLNPGDVYVSKSYADKYSLEKGSSITLREQYTDSTYDFTVTGIYNYEGGLCIFMPMSDLNALFGYDDSFFAGYFSNEKLTDIDPDYVGTVIDLDSLTRISRQLDISMGRLMNLVDIFAVVMFMILVFLLSRTIIEKNAHSISMAKILGYTDAEIGRLYLLPTTFAVVIMLILAIPIVRVLLALIYNGYLLTQMAGYLPLYMDTALYLKMFFFGFGVYLVVMIFEMRKIRSVPMQDALKVVE